MLALTHGCSLVVIQLKDQNNMMISVDTVHCIMSDSLDNRTLCRQGIIVEV